MAGGMAEWLRHLKDLAAGETAGSPMLFSEERGGAGMTPLLSLLNDRTR